MYNCHERRIAASFDEVVRHLALLSGPLDQLWPVDRWPALVLSDGLRIGSAGGHGFIRYAVEVAEPDCLVMRFHPSMRMDGTHSLHAEAAGGDTIVRHVIDAEPSAVMTVLWTTVIEPLHDALIEDLLDNFEAAVAATEAVRAPLPGKVRRRVRLVRMLRPRTIPSGPSGATARVASAATAASLTAVAALHVLWASGSSWPLADRAQFVRSVIGTERRAAMPGAHASLAVAALLGMSAVGVAARPRVNETRALLLSALVTSGTAGILGLRGLGGLTGDATGVLPTTPEFRRNDVMFFAPLCMALAVGARLSGRSRR